jgi:ABC-type microcin C transport system permease subunit YejE
MRSCGFIRRLGALALQLLLAAGATAADLKLGLSADVTTLDPHYLAAQPNLTVAEATLSFLGLGMPITSPSLGLLISNGFAHLISGKYWISFYPGIALLVTIVAINLVGDRMRDVLNPGLASHYGA